MQRHNVMAFDIARPALPVHRFEVEATDLTENPGMHPAKFRQLRLPQLRIPLTTIVLRRQQRPLPDLHRIDEGDVETERFGRRRGGHVLEQSTDRLGIVPAEAEALVVSTNFVMFDDRLVMVEGTAAELTISRPQEVAVYGRAFDLLAGQSVTGQRARELIRRCQEQRASG